MKEIIRAHKFFCRKSQHYMMGNWNKYEKWWNNPNEFKDFNWKKFRYYKGFIPVYLRFMYYSIKDILSTNPHSGLK